MKKYRFALDLQLFSDEMGAETGVETASDAGMHEETSYTEDQTGVESGAAAEPEKQNNFEKAFAKRLADAQSKWEADKQAEIQKMQEQYKDYDVHRKASEFLQRRHGINDFTALREELELAELQDMAEKQEVPVEVMRRIRELEAKAERADELERQREADHQEQQKQQQQQEFERSYWDSLNGFAKEKGVEGDKLNQFMVENSYFVNPDNMAKSFEIALKAMKHDEVAAQLESAKKEGVKQFLQAKGSIPNVKGSTAQGHVASAAPKTLAEARARAMQRLQQ